MIARARSLTRSTLVRYMVSYTAIILALVFGVGIFMNRTYASTVRENIIDSNINKLATIRAQNEQYIASMLTIANQIGLSPYIEPFRFSEQPEKAYHLKKQLVPYTVTTGFVNQLYLIFAEDTYLYSSSTSMPLDLFLDDLMRFELTAPETLLSLIRGDAALSILPCQRVESLMLDGTSAQMVTFIASVTDAGRKTASAIFMVKESTFHQLFADEIKEPRGTYILTGDQVLVADRGLPLPDDMILSAVEGLTGTLVTEITSDGTGYLLVAQAAAKHQMRYVTVIPLSSIRQSTLRAQLGFVGFLLALSVPCMLLIFYLSRRHTKPIRELRHFLGASEPFADDFEAIHSGIEALMGQNEDLSSKLDESLPALRSAFILHLVKGRFRAREDAVTMAATLGLSIDKPHYLVALVTLPPEESARFRIDEAMEKGGTAGYGAELVSKEQFLFVLFSQDQTALADWPQRVAAGFGAMVSESAVYDDFARIGGAYLEASADYENSAVSDDTSAQRFQGMQETGRGEDQPPDLSRVHAHPVIREIMLFMEEHFADPSLSMSAIADAYSISSVRLSLDFKEAVGMSPSEYLLRLRMEKAKALLSKTELSIKDICAQVGYYDASGFIRRFKKYMGVTPVQYRQGVTVQ